ncbi:RrF2 family transcriptional regulator [Dethiosulfatarculus sandiegensis]|uniref:Rrf2 family transcriptional regulator n=1 Tax=Dethiosulfatarculus sandiegensis TaxID=1429043 RepID=A0A0D2JA44_9BACT|nr:Rrf2 family transcriptional regulator [Dethiosulfatarculus sandiegensis]KIX12566.1 Rrf2 family transcriptional regulator [Dethiosulfatarculus sandiegensis]
MNLTRAGEYAVRCVLFLSLHEPSEIVNRKKISAAMDIPSQFLSKIAQRLSRGGLIVITQGSKGGYQLLRAPEEITLLDVIECVEGDIGLNTCILRPESCARTPGCPVHEVWDKARNALRQVLRAADFATLAAREKHSDSS